MPLSLRKTAIAAVPFLATAPAPAQAMMTFPDCVNGPLANNTVCNPRAAPAARAAALVKAMTLNEKLVNLVNTSPGAPRIGLPPYEWWSEALHGVAASPGVSFNRSGAVAIGNGSKSPSPFSYATSFPGPITMSAAFDDELIERVATIVSTEARAFSNAGHAGLDFWTPNINPFKDPRWGRGAETPGEDPFRNKGYVRALLRGLEGPYDRGTANSTRHRAHNGTTHHGANGTHHHHGTHGGGHTHDDPSIRKVIATCKHFAAYDLERWNGTVRYGFDAIVSLQDLSEYYLPPFQECARDSRVGSIMCSYNAVNGTPACASSYLMNDILRKHWGWTEDHQYVTSDCNAILDFDHEHKFSVDGAHAAAAAYGAGTDTVCEVPSYEGTDVRGAYNQSLLSEAVLDRALTRLYEGLVRAGYFDPASASPYRALGWSNVATPEARALARRSAADGFVLKKNDVAGPHALPWANLTGRRVALIGHWADATRQMLGGYSGIPPFYHNPVAAARARNWSYVAYGGLDGAPVNPAPGATDTWTEPALAAARQADAVLYFGGNDLSIEAEDKDRINITWPQAQLDLLTALAALGKPTAVVQLGGGQNDDTQLLRNPNISAVLWAGYPGQDGGNAALDIITGVHAPAGRLPVTQYPGSYIDAVPMTNMALRPGPGNPGRTYRWYDHAVLPFGHGLHYTNFTAGFASAAPDRAIAKTQLVSNGTYALADLVSAESGCTATHRDLCHFAYVNFTVANTGSAAAGAATSDFVALAFLAGSYGPAPYPRKTLVAYRRLRNIAPGQTASGVLSLTLGSLARTDAAGNLVVYPGTYSLLLDEPTQSTTQFTLTGEGVVLDEFPQPGSNITSKA
ncbi:beta-xylosidase [Niveomyces insectorum RCEF 264]|uniref:xylan 1,4-beta-xylosidase n=1 Tax=Niveomyces insectorum RCEF 264 TaxID=1081102 RepID=A0A162J2L5_9HYPO|nr:beta-xylosidase [Niveomyces insectorum RCEF 264]